MKQIILALFIITFFGSCTKDFVETNQNPNQISDELLKQDFNLVGSPIAGMLYNLNGGQIEEDLCQDSWMGFMNTGTPFVGNINNTTYYIRWNSYWGRVYGSVMSPAKQVIRLAEENNLPMFATWAKFIKILSVSKLTAIYGPVIYTNYGSTESTILYDKESDLYNLFFKQLDSIQTVFAANTAYTGFTKFDPSYNGSISEWMKLVNSIRLRLAMRLSKVDPTLAQTEGEKALNDPAGLITTNKDNFNNSLLGNILPLAQICFQWDDTRMGGVMETFLGGLKDSRVSSFFSPVSDMTLVSDHPDFPYKGIRNGAYIDTKADHIPFSKVNSNFNDPPNGGNTTTRRDFTAAEVAFLKAEAGLRGWAGAGDPKENYENGVRLSFADWGAGGVDAYLADNASKPYSKYVDPVDPRNNFTSVSTVTVAWNDADTKETKLEKIITQKWINNFTNTLESWVDFRRTGYPKIPHVAKNDSSPDWGVIPADQWIKRMPYPDAERTGNAEGVADAVSKMGTGAKDDIATRLWWDTGNPSNF